MIPRFSRTPFDEMPFLETQEDIFTRNGSDPVLRALRAAEAKEVSRRFSYVQREFGHGDSVEGI